MPGLSRKPVLLELQWADIRQPRVQPRLVGPEQPREGFVLGVAPRHESLNVQPIYLQRPEQRLAAGVVPASQQLPRRLIEAVMPCSVSTSLKSRLAYWAAPVAVEDLAGLLARVALEPGHAQGINDDVARHVFTH